MVQEINTNAERKATLLDLKTRRPRRPWILLGILAFLFLFPFLTHDDYFLHTAITIFLFLIYTTTYRLVLVTGQLHLGASAFIGAGAYASAILVRDIGISFWISIFLAGIIGALLAVGIGYFALRVKGVYFAIITWGFAEGLRFLYMRVERVFGGPSGLFGIPGPDPLPLFRGIDFFEKSHYYYLALALLLFTLWILFRLEHSRFGLVLAGIREGDRLAESIGVNIMNYKVATFAICSGLAGMGGSFYAHYTLFISPNDFTVLLTIFLALYAVVGGLSKMSGAIIGTTVLFVAGEFFAGYGFYRMMLFAGLTIVFLLILPGGLVDLPGALRSLLNKFRRSRKVPTAHGIF
jgi:branched-chain amino acid transport system permease protein